MQSAKALPVYPSRLKTTEPVKIKVHAPRDWLKISVIGLGITTICLACFAAYQHYVPKYDVAHTPSNPIRTAAVPVALVPQAANVVVTAKPVAVVAAPVAAPLAPALAPSTVQSQPQVVSQPGAQDVLTSTAPVTQQLQPATMPVAVAKPVAARQVVPVAVNPAPVASAPAEFVQALAPSVPKRVVSAPVKHVRVVRAPAPTLTAMPTHAPVYAQPSPQFVVPSRTAALPDVPKFIISNENMPQTLQGKPVKSGILKRPEQPVQPKPVEQKSDSASTKTDPSNPQKLF